ncbi:MAG: tRNA (adenosine(37)-N6)-threonylcarbamoyltransferase complex dimerization subunit type 1 TsaB [Phycisphaerales bacterium]|nr:tRNA (adenosine(37)-N6)-threonylcarbamoyltransferase complex dimerization subunit type 1 TsaB [Phycisphaerales bacterium]
MNGILAIEASQRSISVAVRGANGKVYELSPTGDSRESDVLLPAIVELCAQAALTRRDLRGVAVSTGPGGFTGLRVSLATAKGLCEALGIPAIDIASALVAACGARQHWQVAATTSCVLVALASKGDACWMSLIEANSSGALTLAREGTATAALLEGSSPKVLIADEHLPAPLRARAGELGMQVVAPSFQARDCLCVAEALFEQGSTTDATGLHVRYPREPEAVTLWRARYPAGFVAKK